MSSDQLKIAPNARIPVQEDDAVFVVVQTLYRREDFKLNWITLKEHCKASIFKTKKAEYRITVSEEVLSIFNIFTRFLLTGKYWGANDDKWPIRKTLPSLHCWLLGEQLGCSAFQDLAMERLYYHHYQALGIFVAKGLSLNFKPIDREIMEYVARNSSKGSLLRQFMLDAVVATQLGKWGQDIRAGIQVIHDPEWSAEKARNAGSNMKVIAVYKNSTYLLKGYKYPIILGASPDVAMAIAKGKK